MSALTSHALTGNEDLMKQLECPICFEYCVPPIYMCKNGHNVCSICRASLDECGVCREPGKPSIRNIPVEGISSLLVKVKCKHSENGCQALFHVNDLQAHLPKCEYTYECRFDCRWKGRISDLEMHAVNTHSNHLWECLQGKIVQLHLVRTHYSYCMTLFAVGGRLFWYTHEFDVVNSIFSVSVVQARLDEARGAAFTFVIEFETKDRLKKFRVESTVAADKSPTGMTHISLTNVVESYKKDGIIPFKFSISFDGK